MSIATAITTAQGRVSNAYTAVSNKGGTLPATRNLSNLPAAIESIPSGGGGGATVVAKAVAGTQSYSEDDKVILIPTGVIYSDSHVSTSADTNTAGSDNLNVLPGFGELSYSLGVTAPISPAQYNYDHVPDRKVAQCFWNSSYTDFSTVNILVNGNIATAYKNIHYDGALKFALNASGTNRWGVIYNSLGYFGDDNAYIKCWDFNTDDMATNDQIAVVDKFAKVCNRRYSSHIYWIDSNGTPHDYTGANRNVVPSKYNGNWYFVDQNGVKPVTDTSTTAYTVSGYNTYTDYWCNLFFDANVDYFWEWHGDWYFRKIDKTNTVWTVSSDNIIAGKYKACARTGTVGLDNFYIRSKDHGDTVESFVSTTDFGYDSNTGIGNKVAHFIFTKATEEVERLPDVFPEIPDTYLCCGGIQVNWDLGLIGVTVGYKTGTLETCTVYVKKLDDTAGIYKYYAYPNKKENFFSKALTGFVVDNQGVNALGDTTLEVATVEDPNEDPWTNIDIVFGMSIIVNEGVI